MPGSRRGRKRPPQALTEPSRRPPLEPPAPPAGRFLVLGRSSPLRIATCATAIRDIETCEGSTQRSAGSCSTPLSRWCAAASRAGNALRRQRASRREISRSRPLVALTNRDLRNSYMRYRDLRGQRAAQRRLVFNAALAVVRGSVAGRKRPPQAARRPRQSLPHLPPGDFSFSAA